jgi:hypothetical protein
MAAKTNRCGHGKVTGMKRKTRAAAAAVLSLTLAACGSSTAKTATPAAPANTSATTATTSTTTATTSAATTAPTGAAIPTLGHKAGIFIRGQGFGAVKPPRVSNNGGDPTGLVTKIAWHSWGSAKAVGTGISTYITPTQAVAEGTQQPATIVAFNLGTCHGKLMYRAVEWYFPQHNGHFNPNTYENICTGSFVGNSR